MSAIVQPDADDFAGIGCTRCEFKQGFISVKSLRSFIMIRQRAGKFTQAVERRFPSIEHFSQRCRNSLRCQLRQCIQRRRRIQNALFPLHTPPQVA
ncbi:hypothetical protein D3C87_1990550 [compost metagenome]